MLKKYLLPAALMAYTTLIPTSIEAAPAGVDGRGVLQRTQRRSSQGRQRESPRRQSRQRPNINNCESIRTSYDGSSWKAECDTNGDGRYSELNGSLVRRLGSDTYNFPQITSGKVMLPSNRISPQSLCEDDRTGPYTVGRHKGSNIFTPDRGAFNLEGTEYTCKPQQTLDNCDSINVTYEDNSWVAKCDESNLDGSLISRLGDDVKALPTISEGMVHLPHNSVTPGSLCTPARTIFGPNEYPVGQHKGSNIFSPNGSIMVLKEGSNSTYQCVVQDGNAQSRGSSSPSETSFSLGIDGRFAGNFDQASVYGIFTVGDLSLGLNYGLYRINVPVTQNRDRLFTYRAANIETGKLENFEELLNANFTGHAEGDFTRFTFGYSLPMDINVGGELGYQRKTLTLESSSLPSHYTNQTLVLYGGAETSFSGSVSWNPEINGWLSGNVCGGYDSLDHIRGNVCAGLEADISNFRVSAGVQLNNVTEPKLGNASVGFKVGYIIK